MCTACAPDAHGICIAGALSDRCLPLRGHRRGGNLGGGGARRDRCGLPRPTRLVHVAGGRHAVGARVPAAAHLARVGCQPAAAAAARAAARHLHPQAGWHARLRGIPTELLLLHAGRPARNPRP
eukprot:scaffold3452_cov61-Phaeocystis_antarctica.AAC.2